MPKFIELNAIDLRREAEVLDRNQNAAISYARMPSPSGAPGERFAGLDYDDLERPIPVTVPVYPAYIAVEAVREFYKRKPDQNGNEREGTRIVFLNGAATIVKETVIEVLEALRRNGDDVLTSLAASARAN